MIFFHFPVAAKASGRPARLFSLNSRFLAAR